MRRRKCRGAVERRQHAERPPERRSARVAELHDVALAHRLAGVESIAGRVLDRGRVAARELAFPASAIVRPTCSPDAATSWCATRAGQRDAVPRKSDSLGHVWFYLSSVGDVPDDDGRSRQPSPAGHYAVGVEHASLDEMQSLGALALSAMDWVFCRGSTRRDFADAAGGDDPRVSAKTRRCSENASATRAALRLVRAERLQPNESFGAARGGEQRTAG